MAEERRWTTFGAAHKFEQAAREAEKKRNFRLAAALYRAALLVLKGDSLEDGLWMHADLDAFPHGEAPQWGVMSHTQETTPPTEQKS